MVLGWTLFTFGFSEYMDERGESQPALVMIHSEVASDGLIGLNISELSKCFPIYKFIRKNRIGTGTLEDSNSLLK